MSTRIFALIIGIDNYKSGHIWNLHSCVEDAKKIKHWLTDSLHVPRDQICVLLDRHAAKQKIEDSFVEHLTNNPSIERGDAMLIYFAGHGSRLSPPTDWYPSDSTSDVVEVLCPYDHDTKTSHGTVAGISDRSLRALLQDLAAAKGNNVTLVLDCCFSPIQNIANIRERSTTRWTKTIKAVPDDLYQGIWPSARGRTSSSTSGFFHPEASHIVLAACSAGEKAMEDKEGGRFTSSLLQATSDLPLHRTTYVQLMEYMMRTNSDLQTFICAGKHKNKVLFDDVPFATDNRLSPAALDEETKSIRIDVGAIHGIIEGCEFSLHLHNRHCSLNPTLGSAVVSEVRPTCCFARVKSQASNLPKLFWAKMSRWNNRRPFRVYLKSTWTSFIGMWKLRKTLPTKPGVVPEKNVFNVLRVKKPNLADISLALGSNGSVVVQRNPILATGSMQVAKITNKNSNEVIDDAARFNLHLLRKNIEMPLQNLIDMELHRIDPISWSTTSSNLLQNGTATIPCEDGAIYQVTLHNKSAIDIWPYLAYLDPNCYSITILYSPDHSKDPPLRSQSSFQIGSGQPGSEALTFSFAAHNHMNSGYLKLFLSSIPVSMKVLEQDPMPHWTDDKDIPGADPSLPSKIPIWDTALGSLLFIRHPDGNS